MRAANSSSNRRQAVPDKGTPSFRSQRGNEVRVSRDNARLVFARVAAKGQTLALSLFQETRKSRHYLLALLLLLVALMR
jgi:hypothetical protein